LAGNRYFYTFIGNGYRLSVFWYCYIAGPDPLAAFLTNHRQIIYRFFMRKVVMAITCILALNSAFGQAKKAKLEISPLTGDFYIYTTYNFYQEYQVPANGMYLVTNSGVVMFDTPWDTTQFQPLLDSIKLKHNKPVVMCFATHWHSDKTAGLEYYRKQGIKTYTTTLTDELSKKNNAKRAEFLMQGDTVFQVGQYSFETYYPGHGHTEDNIIIWFKKEKILYGGCLIKGAEDKDLGYLGDASVTAYASTLKKVQQKCRKPRFIIVAHSDWKNINSLKHSIHMAKALKKKNAR
jgi:metallo-beta-lactamase class B